MYNQTLICCGVRIEKAVNVTYSEFVVVALGMQDVMPMRYIVTCGLFNSTIFFHVPHKSTIFEKKTPHH